MLQLEKLEKHLAAQTALRDKANAQNNASANSNSVGANTHALSNGAACLHDDEDKHDHTRGKAPSHHSNVLSHRIQYKCSFT